MIRRGRGVVGWITFICNDDRVYIHYKTISITPVVSFRTDGHCMQLLLYGIIDYLSRGEGVSKNTFTD